MALSDGLTGLFNRAYFDATIEQETVSLRSKKPLSPFRSSISIISKINDTHGQQAGDQVLEKVALVLVGTAALRYSPVASGGEEFAIILPETPRSHAAMVAERIRQKVSDLDCGFSVTTSIGINCADRPEGLVPQTLIAGADQGAVCGQA
ncbi:MAG: GGDEF domain-containing protein [Syntrophotaleaceae bacterium]